MSEKLGIKAGHQVSLCGAPKNFGRTLDPLPDDVVVRTRPSRQAAVVLLFSRAASKLRVAFPAAVERLPTGGMIWVAWPKKASGEPTDLTENVVREIGLATGLVDIKVCAIDDTWSGLKFVRRRVPART